jgi:predicted transcriptional regulator
MDHVLQAPVGSTILRDTSMTKLLERAMERAQALPAAVQDEIARLVLAHAGEGEKVLTLTPAEEADLLEARAEMERGEFATDEEVNAVFAKYRASAGR